MIGETGWPSQGKQRRGAAVAYQPGPRGSEILVTGEAGEFRDNVIEAYDQPWKRQLEGTVGGNWGLFTSVMREVKISAGRRHQQFPVETGRWSGMVLSVLVLRRRHR